MSVEAKDPLTLLLNTLATFIETAPSIKRAMGLARKNLNAFNKTRVGSQTETKNEADVPSIEIANIGGALNLSVASNMITLETNYNIALNSGDRRVTHQMFPVLWAVIAAFGADINPVPPAESPFLSLKWKGRNFCRKHEFTNITAGQSDPAMNRGIIGWTGICAVKFYLHFQQSDLRLFIQEG